MPQQPILACPHLPQVNNDLPSTHTRIHRAECGEPFYIACLELAQSLWVTQRPAQAILQLDKAMMANIAADSEVLRTHPIPYAAMLWIIENTPALDFIGNPVRHFQHLASRMNWKQPQPELRIARAWICLHLTEVSVAQQEYPRDHQQIDRENLQIPSRDSALTRLLELSPHQSEKDWIKEVLNQ
jgi:hypothetical protein